MGTGYPMRVTEGFALSPNWEERLTREGTPVSIGGSGYVTSPASFATPTTLVTTTALRMVGQITYVDSLTISASQAHQGLIGISGTTIASSTAFPQWNRVYTIGAGGSITFPFKRLFRPYEVALTGFQMTSLRYLGQTPGSDMIGASVSLNATTVTDDFHFGAKHTVLFAGDSIGAGTGATRTAEMWAMLARDHLRVLGNDVRIVLKAIGGTTTADHETLRATGYHDIAQCSLGVYSLGMNDGIQSDSAATSLANAQAYWTWFRDRYPNATLIVCGPSPAENNGTESNLVTLRAALSGWVTTAAHPRLKYITLASAFDRTAGTAFYYSGDTAGSRVHPNVAGHAAIATAFNTAFDALGVTLAVL